MRVINLHKLLLLFFSIFFGTTFSGYAQCPKAESYLSKVEQGQQYSFAGDFESSKCQCLAGVSNERAKELQTAMKYDKDQYERLKNSSDPNLGSIPPCVIISGIGSRISGSSDCGNIDKLIELSKEKRYYNDAARFMQFKCNCLNGVYKSKEAQESAINGMKYYKGTYDNQKRAGDPQLTIPSQCNIGSGGAESSKDDFQQTLRNYSKAYSMIESSQQRAASVANQMKSLSKISANATPQDIMQQYRQNLERMNQLEMQLRQDIATTNIEGGISILDDIQTGNDEGAVYSILGMAGKFIEDQSIKKEVVNQREALVNEVKNMMLTAAREMYQENMKSRDKWLQHAANVLDKERETNFMKLADYYEDYANYLNNNFSYNNTKWANYKRELPSESMMGPKVSNPTHTDYAKAAERKYELYKETKEGALLEGAVKYMNAALNSNKGNISYYERLAEIAMDYDANMAMTTYIAAIQLKPTLSQSDEFKKLQDKYILKSWIHFLNFKEKYNPEGEYAKYYSKSDIKKHYKAPLQFFQEMIDNGIYKMPLKAGSIPIAILSTEYGPAKQKNLSMFEKVVKMLPAESASEQKLLFTKMLHECVITNSIATLNILYRKGADVDMKIDGKNAIELALENISYRIYPMLIAHSSEAKKHQDSYQSSLIFKINAFSKAVKPNEKKAIVQSVSDEEKQIKLGKYLIDNSLINSEFVAEIPAIQNSKNELGFQQYFESIFISSLSNKAMDVELSQIVPNLSGENANSNYQEYLKSIQIRYLSKLLIEHDLITFLPQLMPSPWLLPNLSNEEEKEILNYRNKECLLCIQSIPIEYRVEKAIVYFHTTKLIGSNEMVKTLREALVNYQKTGILSHSNNKLQYSIDLINNYYNIEAYKYDLPLANVESGHKARPVDYSVETYAHIVLLNDNYPVFEAFSDKYDLVNISNKNGKTVLDYINQLIIEEPNYVKYAALPSIAKAYDWNRKIDGESAFEILVHKNETGIILDLALQGILKEDFTPFMHKWAKEGRFRSIIELHKKGLIDINTKDSEGRNVLHYFISYFTDDFLKPMEDEDAYTYTISFPTVAMVKEKYGLELFTIVDKSIATNNKITPYDLLQNIFKDAEHKFSYPKTEKQKLKEWAKVIK